MRECANQITQFAKQTDTTVFVVGHVTKDGSIAGPRVLEHVVDTVLYFEGDEGGRYRVLRAVKNRFGAVNELGVFAMQDTGLKGVKNPSAIFLSQRSEHTPGSVITVTCEATRPLLLEVQSLVDDNPTGHARRVNSGYRTKPLNHVARNIASTRRHCYLRQRCFCKYRWRRVIERNRCRLWPFFWQPIQALEILH